MRRYASVVAVLFLLAAVPSAQNPVPQDVPAPSSQLPVKRVVLYKTGVGYFEHLGTIRDNQNITIRFTSAQLNDVLKSLTAIDLGKGQVSSINYSSVAPLEQRLGGLRLPVGEGTTSLQLLGTLRGARVEVVAAGVSIAGRLLSVEQRMRIIRDGDAAPVDMLSIVTDGGELRTFELTPAVRVRIVDHDLRQEIGRYLDVVGSSREQDVRNMVISTAGTGERPLFVSYISEVPVWKSTYRLVIPKQGKPLLQGWAIVDNTIGENWRNVELSLVAGAPQSFVQQVSQPFYTRRPVVPMPSNVLLAPQTHGATLQAGIGRLIGRVTDPSGAGLPGVAVSLSDGSGIRSGTTTKVEGSYELTAVAGQYRIRFALSGFSSQVSEVTVPGGSEGRLDAVMQVGGTEEAVQVAAEPPAPPPAPSADNRMRREARSGRVGGVVSGAAGGRVAYNQMAELDPAAVGVELGDLFEYRIKEPITLRKNQSALVPIINAAIDAEKVSLWNRATGSGRPLRALWITNSTGLTLDGGSLTVVDGEAFAGEGLVEAVKPGEKRIVSYAADLALLVNATADSTPRRVFRARARDGILITEIEDRTNWTYKVRSQAASSSALIIEHAIRPGWKLADGQLTAESTPQAHRFRLAVDPGKEASLVVRETMSGASQMRIGEVTEQIVVQLVASGLPASELERALKPVLDKKAELATLERRLADLDGQHNRIVQDQQRVRENMKALRGSAEERELLQRYTRQLNEQENRLEALQQEIAKATSERESIRGALASIIATLSFEIGGK